MRQLLTFLLLASLSAFAGAEGVYKYIDKEGRVVYTDDPKAGGGTAQRIWDSTTVIPALPATGGTVRQEARKADQRLAELDRAVEDIAAATTALRDAEARKLAGVEPIEGERQGRRFRPEYWERQQALQRDVDAAQRRLDDANARRNELR